MFRIARAGRQPSGGASRRARGWLLGLILVAGATVSAGPVEAKVFLTLDQALELAFPGCSVEQETVYLTDPQRLRAQELSGEEIESSLVRPYRARCGGADGGTAYFDSHRVRTLAETLMVVVGPEGKIRRVEILSFDEPTDYIPVDAWYDQFTSKRLDPELELKRGIRQVTGATLTARATTEAVRRVLALHRVIAGGTATGSDTDTGTEAANR